MIWTGTCAAAAEANGGTISLTLEIGRCILMKFFGTRLLYLLPALAWGALVLAPAGGRAESAFPSVGILEAMEREVRDLVDAVSPSVVTVRAIPKSDPVESQQASKRPPRAMSVGSGIVLDTAGLILTTARVVEGSDDFWVETWDGRLFRAMLLGSGRSVAVLRIKADGLTPARIGDGADLGVGSFVAAIGNSYGYAGALSWGEINGFRPDGTIQLSLGVPAGSSGGALVDTKGRVIGLIRAKISEPYYLDPLYLPGVEGQAPIAIPGRRLELPTSSVSLAIPIGAALRDAARLTETGDAAPAYIGVYVEDLTGWYPAHFKIEHGVLVTGVVKRTPAHRSGLQMGDVITTVDQDEVRTVQRFRQMILQARPGQRLFFDLVRGGKPLKLVIEAGRADLLHLSATTSRVPPVVESSKVHPLAAPNGAGASALRVLTAPSGRAEPAQPADDRDWEKRLLRLERIIDSLKRELAPPVTRP